jgi:hypothetical protein
MAGVERPPPAHVLLAYAADGWAAENGRFNPSGKPKPPEPAAWRPVVATLLHEADGLDRLRDLALAGMMAWNVDPSIIACVAPAFATPDFAAALAWRLGMVGYRGPRSAPVPAADTPAINSSTPAMALFKRPGEKPVKS